MRSFSLDNALRSAPVTPRRNELMTYVSETTILGVHFNVDEGERLPKSIISPHSLNPGRPSILDASKESPFQVREEEKFTGDETGDVILDGISHSQCLQFLCRKGPSFRMKNLKDRETICSALLAMAEHVKMLPPANDPLPTDLLNMTLWKASLWELVLEMKTVEENFPSLVGKCGVYVLTSSPYAAFLRALAAEIADARS